MRLSFLSFKQEYEERAVLKIMAYNTQLVGCRMQGAGGYFDVKRFHGIRRPQAGHTFRRTRKDS